MAKKSTHPDVEFHVLGDNGRDLYFKEFDEAAATAARSSLRLGSKWTNVSVLVHSEAGAKWWGGDAAVEQYRSDPDASVFEQLGLKVESRGMIA